MPRKRYSILEAMADKTKKPDALGFQPLDPTLVAAAMRSIRKEPS